MGNLFMGQLYMGNRKTNFDVVLEPGNWSLDNFGETLIATILMENLTWDGRSNPRTNRATLMTGVQQLQD